VHWYNQDHHHSSLAGFTPQQVFTGEYLEVAQVRQMALDDMYDRHPERFKGRPTVQMPATEVGINPVPEGADQATVEKGVNFPTLQRVIAKVS